MYIPIPFHFNPIRELEWISAPSVYSGGIKYPSWRGAALYLYMVGLPSWEQWI